MIVDAHSHLGYDYVFEENFTAEDLKASMDGNGIDASVVQPGSVLDLDTVVAQHDAIAALSKGMEGRIYGMANPNPRLKAGEYRRELERCVKDLGFVGVKLHPLAHAINVNQSAGRRVFEAASDLGIPVMVHTGSGIPWSLPSALIPVAKEFRNLKVILAHSGGPMFSSEAVLAAQLCPNVYLETSWIPSITIKSFVKSVGADRIMFGSDHGSNAATELVKFRTAGLGREELEACLGRTAAAVFKIPFR
ncbi:MAG: amidohydrolase [Candidatus Brockarchaeota archaeon]|nr:amidohydrolase [Candidatus Brockarchaeota archaeon]